MQKCRGRILHAALLHLFALCRILCTQIRSLSDATLDTSCFLRFAVTLMLLAKLLLVNAGDTRFCEFKASISYELMKSMYESMPFHCPPYLTVAYVVMYGSCLWAYSPRLLVCTDNSDNRIPAAWRTDRPIAIIKPTCTGWAKKLHTAFFAITLATLNQF